MEDEVKDKIIEDIWKEYDHYFVEFKKYNYIAMVETILQKAIEIARRELLPYKMFVEHVYNHRDKAEQQTLEEWVQCRICHKFFNQIVSEEK